MKHVFVVQSNITYLAGLGVIAKHELPLCDVVMLSEGYVKETPVKVHPIALYQSFFKMIVAPRNYFNIGRKVDKFLGDFLKGDDFELYTPVLTNLARLVVTNEACVNLNFIEEGISSYHRGFDLDTVITYYRNDCNRPSFSGKYLRELKTAVVLSLRGFSPKMISYPIFYQAYTDSPGVRFFGFQEDCFPLCLSREVISFEQVGQRFKFDTKCDFRNCAIWIGDDCVSCYNYPLENYLEGIQRGFVDKIDETQEVYVKFHPSEHHVSRQATLELIAKNGIAATVIPDDVILEIELVGKDDVALYGTYSSLLIYGAMMGCKTFSVQNYLKTPFAVSVPLFKKMVKCI